MKLKLVRKLFLHNVASYTCEITNGKQYFTFGNKKYVNCVNCNVARLFNFVRERYRVKGK